MHINRILNFIKRCWTWWGFFLYQQGVGGWGTKKSYKHNVRTRILRSKSISAQSWVMMRTPHFFVVVLRFPNNLEKNLNKSFRKSYFLTFWWNLKFYNGTRSLLSLRPNYQLKKITGLRNEFDFQRCVFTSLVSIA